MSLLKRHQIFIDNQCFAALKGDREGFGESILKRKVFRETLAIVSSNLLHATVHIALLTNLLVGCLVLVAGVATFPREVLILAL